MTQPDPSHGPPLQASVPGQHDAKPRTDSNAPLDSQTLLLGRKEVLITHGGVTYRLQATRQGKLILTK